MLGYLKKLRVKMEVFHRKWFTVNRLLLAIAAFTVIQNEFLCYTFSAFSWPTIDGALDDSNDHLRILFVADPQIVGFHDGWIARTDCDRYLSKTYSHAYKHTRPHVVIFMGDLLDEGSTSTDEDYKVYVDRFSAIFSVDTGVKIIAIPGDNDVGGEGFDLKEDVKLKRFHNHFIRDFEGSDRNDHVPLDFVDFFTMSYDYGERITPEKETNFQNLKQEQKSKISILLNHMGLVDRQDIRELDKIWKPSFIFSAHTHLARLHTCVECKEKPDDGIEHVRHRLNGNVMKMADNTVYDFDLLSSVTLNEIVVPTCSYRMGVPTMGYGYAVMEPSGKLQYTILWLPSRYDNLHIYIVVLIVLAVLFVLNILYIKIFSTWKYTLLPLYNR